MMGNTSTTLFCIPFSGGNAYSYAGFKKYLPPDVDIRPLELPGRGRRISEPLVRSIEAMTADLVSQIERQIDGPYAIFGHSLGALLGIMVCRAIAATNTDLPVMLVLSGMTAPALIESNDEHRLPDDRFIDRLRSMGGTPEELLADQSFLEYFLPVVRADFQSIAAYRHTPRTFPLDVPITVLLGSEEDVTDEAARAWQQETDSGVCIHRFPGGHFFIYDHTEALCTLIARKVALGRELQHADR